MTNKIRKITVRRATSSRTRSVSIEHRALPTPERMRRAGADFQRGAGGQITFLDNPFGRAVARGHISKEQYSAGQKFRHHWYHAGLAGQVVSIDLDRVFGTELGAFSTEALSEGQVFHRQSYREAVQATGKIGSHVLEWVICREFAFEEVGYSLGWTSRPQAHAAAVERLKIALEELCRLWSIV